MNRSFYTYAIFFSGLYTLTVFLRSIIVFQLGARVRELPSLTSWLVFESLVWLAWALVLLRYYHHKQYQFTFWALVANIAATLFYFILASSLLKTNEFTDGYIMATLVLLGTGVLYGISLIFSEAGKRSWLKAAGIFSSCMGLILFFSVFLAFYVNSFLLNGTTAKIEQWVSLVGSLVPALYIMNFRSERATAEKVIRLYHKTLHEVMGFAAVLALVAALFFLPRLVSDSIQLANHPDHVPEYLKKLAQPFEARTYGNNAGDTLQYRLLKPLDYDSTKQYPLVVCLHGSSGCGTDNAKQVVASLPVQLLSAQENRMKYPAFLFVPQCPPQMGWGGIPHLPAVDALVFDTILALEKEFPIDADRRYVAGNSLGGYGAWHLICTRPELFAAAIPISGGGNPALAQNIVDMPVWAFHGAKDRNVPVSGSRDIIEAIKEGGGDPRYTEYPDKAHAIWSEVKATPGLLDWLFAQQRD